jgi:diacylglycerol O-acyltransferase / wax synthase
VERVGGLDAVFLAIEEPVSPMNIGSVGIFDGPAPSLASVQSAVATRIALVPRCRQRVRESWRGIARPMWIDDVRFEFGDHVHHVTLPSDDPEALERFVERVMAQPLDRRRALWQMWVVDGLEDDRWAVVSKMHHCMIDGIAGTDLLTLVMDSDPDVEHPPATLPRAAREPTAVESMRFSSVMIARSMWAHIRHLARSVVHPHTTWRRLRDIVAGGRALWLQPSHRESPLTGPIGPHRRWAHTRASLSDVATIRRAFGGTVNDVVLAAATRGFRELLDARGQPLDGRTVMALVPVSTRTADEHGRLDNRVAVTHALLPVGIDDPVEMYRTIRRHLDEVKASHQTDASSVLLHTGDYTPHLVAAAVARAVVRVQQNIETIATNVPGPRTPMYLCGRPMIEMYPFAPIAGRIRIAVAIWSYCGVLFLGITGDRDSTDDLDILVRAIDRGFDALLTAARKAA